MFTLMQLPYSYDALEPFIDAKTVEIHYSKHHQTYVNNLNVLVEANPELQNKTLDQILVNADQLREEIKQPVINNAGQVYNHNIYWESLASGTQTTPTDALLEKITEDFGSFEAFKEVFSNAGKTQFGSGWVWLSVNEQGKLVVDKTSNADSPLMHGKQPLLTMDVWEHAYYLNYQNRRPDYITAFWNIVNWQEVGQKYQETLAQ